MSCATVPLSLPLYQHPPIYTLKNALSLLEGLFFCPWPCPGKDLEGTKQPYIRPGNPPRAFAGGTVILNYSMPAVSPRLYFENAVGRLYEHPDGYALFKFNPGKRKFSELQGLLGHVRNLLERNRWHRFLADQRLLAPFTPEEVVWIVDHWHATAAHHPAGLYGAVVMAQDVFARLAMAQIVQQANAASMHFRRFETEAEATGWLEQVG